MLGLLGATLGKIANEIMNLEADEVGEVAEPFSEGKVGSSTMPHKRNPAVVETVVTLSRAIRYSVAMMHDAQMAEHERDVAAVRMEWKAVPEACMMTAAMLEMMHQALSGLTVKTDRMRANLDLLGGFLMSERVMFALAEKVGKQSAHELVYAAAMQGWRLASPSSKLCCATLRSATHWIPHYSSSFLTQPPMSGWRQ